MSTPDVIVTERQQPPRKRYHCRYGRCDPYYPCNCVVDNVGRSQPEIVAEPVTCQPVGVASPPPFAPRQRRRYYCGYGRCDPYYPCRYGGGGMGAYDAFAMMELERERQNMITREEMMIMGNDMIMEDIALMNGDVGMAEDIGMMGDMQMMQLEMERMW